MAIGPGVADEGRCHAGAVNADRKDRGAASRTVANLTGGRGNASKSSPAMVECQAL